jgi:hypothetical protein
VEKMQEKGGEKIKYERKKGVRYKDMREIIPC